MSCSCARTVGTTIGGRRTTGASDRQPHGSASGRSHSSRAPLPEKPQTHCGCYARNLHRSHYEMPLWHEKNNTRWRGFAALGWRRKLTHPAGYVRMRARSTTRAAVRPADPRRGMAQSGSASALGAEGRGFKSLCPDQFPAGAPNDQHLTADADSRAAVLRCRIARAASMLIVGQGKGVAP